MTPWTVAHQAPLSMGFSSQEYWSGLPCPPQEDLSDPGIEPLNPASAGRLFTTRATWEAPVKTQHSQILKQTNKKILSVAAAMTATFNFQMPTVVVAAPTVQG